MTKPPLEIRAIRALAAPETFNKGRQYFRDDAVGVLTRRGGEISADVEGSAFAPHAVRIRLAGAGVADTRCTCGDQWSGFCAHIVAVLCKLEADGAEISERRTLPEILADLGEERLIDIITRRAGVDPDLAIWIEREIEATTGLGGARGEAAARRRMQVDQAPLMTQAHAFVRGRYQRRGYWEGYRSGGSDDDLQALVATSLSYLEVGDGRNALRVLETLAEECVHGWIHEGHADDEDMCLLFDEIAHLLAEAALMSDLAPEERDALSVAIEGWQGEISDFGLDNCFTLPLRAIETGWDQSELQAVFSGQARTWPPSEPVDDTELRLTEIRLRVLEASDRTDDYLRLSAAAGAYTEHAAHLIKRGHIDEGVAYAREMLKAPSEAHRVAKALREVGADDHALALAAHGLALQGARPGLLQTLEFSSAVRREGDRPHGFASLARWLRDYAGGLGDINCALEAANIAFAQTNALEDFRAAETWATSESAGTAWPALRGAMLEALSKAGHAGDKTRIYLEEELIDDAVRSVSGAATYQTDADTLMRLADAAAASHADWVITLAVGKARAIIDNKRSGHYQEAANWLTRAVRAYQASGRAGDGARLIESLIDEHRAKHKLRPLLERLR